MLDLAKHKTLWTIRKYENDEAVRDNRPYEVNEIPYNCLLGEGITLLQNLLIGAGGTPFNNANAYIGVGDSNTAAVQGQTGLQAGSNKAYQPMATSYPTVTNQTTDWRASFDGSTANFHWQEFTVANGNSDSAVNLNRAVSDQGTKTAGQTWTVDVQITWS